MSPETESIGKVLYKSAQKSLDKDDNDDYQELLQAGWDALKMAIKHPAVNDTHSTQVAEPEQQMEIICTSHQEFLVEFNDWIVPVIKEISRLESKDMLCLKDETARMASYHQKNGMSKEKATIQANKDINWKAMKNQKTDRVQAHVTEEINRVKKWKLEGTNAKEAPSTPFLDRIGLVCASAGITRPVYLSWISLLHERNCSCHSVIPEPINFKTGGPNNEVDWVAMETAISAKKKDVCDRYKMGTLNKKQYEYLSDAIDRYSSIYFEGPGSVRSSKAAKVEELNTQNQTQNPKISLPPEYYFSPYTEGKWDDILQEDNH